MKSIHLKNNPIQEISPEDYDSTKDGLPEENTYSDSTAGQTYVYAANGTLTSETNRIGVTTTYTYYSTGEKKSESFDSYKYDYDVKGNLTKVYVDGVNTLTYSYDESYNLTSEVYANGQSIRYEYDDNGNCIKQYHNNDTSAYVTYTYNEDGELTEKINTDTGLKYVYDGDNVSVYKTSDNTLVQSYVSVETEKDEETNTEAYTTVTESHFGTAYSSVVKEKSVSYTTGSNTVEYSYQTTGSDEDEKVSSDIVKNGDITALSSAYTYDDDGNITNKQYSYKDNGENQTVDFVNEYDNKGKITAKGYYDLSEYYTYDSNDQLVRVDSGTYDSYTSTYTYDSRGNITSKKVYDYTRNETITSSPTATTTFTYANSGWKDLLVAVNGVELTYDANGNVLTYGDKEFTWNTGRNLESIVDGDNTYSYTYDENGIRTSKTVNGVTTYYNTKDGVILSQSDGTNTMYFQYDTSGIPLGFICNGVQYFYLTNQMGDVLAITDTAGTIVGNYEYDAWGTVTVADTEIAQQNPIRYRGYYYDSETGYYYLQSRYYDSEICRFINADIPEIAQISKGVPYGTNLFIYCDNNPINNSDPTGTFGTPIQWAFAIMGALLGLPFGKWFANKLGYYSGAKYIAIRAAAVVGGAALGWFAGSLLIKLVKSYLTSHPQTAIKIVAKYGPKTLIKFRSIFGLSASFMGTALQSSISKAIGKVSKFSVSAKHLANAGGRYSKFDTTSQSTVRNLIKTALKSKLFSEIGDNGNNSYYIIVNMGKVIGTKGERYIKIIIDAAGNIWTAYSKK